MGTSILNALQDAVFATDRDLFEDCDFQQNGQTAATHICKAILDHSEALRMSIAAYQKSLDADKANKAAEEILEIF
jgi:uncharacterized protein (DUF927 family)